jgi:hypothetical protein
MNKDPLFWRRRGRHGVADLVVDALKEDAYPMRRHAPGSGLSTRKGWSLKTGPISPSISWSARHEFMADHLSPSPCYAHRSYGASGHCGFTSAISNEWQINEHRSSSRFRIQPRPVPAEEAFGLTGGKAVLSGSPFDPSSSAVSALSLVREQRLYVPQCRIRDSRL